MRVTFVETTGFTESISYLMTDQTYARLQLLLMRNPGSGSVMPGCGGLRKIRTADPKRSKGKRGGARVIFLNVPAARRIYMLDVYGKDEKDDLAPDERKHLRLLAERLKQDATSAQNRFHEENE